MNLLTWLDALGAVDSADFSGFADADAADSPAASRRAALARLGRGAVAAVPLIGTATGALAGPRPRVTSIVTDAFNLVLRVAYVPRALLTDALATGGTPLNATERDQLQSTKLLLDDLIARLQSTVSLSGDTTAALPPRSYDFSGNANAGGGGPLNPIGSSADLLLLTQVLLDTLSRTLISTLPALVINAIFSEMAGQLLGTTSRLAAGVRALRAATGAPVQPWIVDAEGTTALPAIFTTQTTPYAGEDSKIVFGVLDLAATVKPVLPQPLPDGTVLTAAFDQPLALMPAAMGALAEVLPETAVNRLLAPFVVV